MELISVHHNSTTDSNKIESDIFLAASGSEARSVYFPEKLKKADINKYVLAFKNNKNELYRPENDAFFVNDNYTVLVTDAADIPDFDQVFSCIEGDDVEVLVDISVMTRKWYFSLLKYIVDMEDFNSVKLKVIYTPAVYAEPYQFKKKGKLNKHSFLDDTFSNYSNKKEKSALIMGLGRDQGACQFIYESIQADDVFLLYADPLHEKTYVENVFVNNHELISDVSIKNLKSFPLDNTKKIYDLLLDLILPLRQTHRIMIVPQGPKIFSLMSMLIQLTYPDIELYFPEFKLKQTKDRIAYKQPVSLDLLFEEE